MKPLEIKTIADGFKANKELWNWINDTGRNPDDLCELCWFKEQGKPYCTECWEKWKNPLKFGTE